MAYTDRLALYEKIEESRKRPLIAYVTSSRPNASAQMGSDVISEFIKHLKELPKEAKEIDILIVSRGGDPTVSWRIISLLRERFKKVGILLPYEAYSAATLLALGGDEILMHPFSNLGPVDPQLTGKRQVPGQPQQETFHFGAEDLRNYFDYVRKDVGISDQEQLQRSFELVCKDIGAIPIGVAKRSSNLSLSMGEKLLSLHMKDQNKVKAIAEALNRSFYHHGHAVSRTEAKEIGLPVKEPTDIENLMWQVWENIENEMMCNHPFDPMEIVSSNAIAPSIFGPVQQFQLPANIPANLLPQIMQQLLQQIQIININPIDYELLQATVESIKGKSEFKSQGKIFARRMPDSNIAINVIRTSGGWNYTKSEE